MCSHVYSHTVDFFLETALLCLCAYGETINLKRNAVKIID